MTQKGRQIQADLTDTVIGDEFTEVDFDPKFDADTKEARLRSNIRTVLEARIGNKSTIIHVDELQDAIVNKLSEMSDIEVINFSREHKDEIQLFFEYKTFLDSDGYGDLDARTLKLMDGLGIDIDEYMNKAEVKSEVKTKLLLINDLVDLKKELRSRLDDQ